jgi:uncharacterized protein (UPF0297 family)
LKAGFEFLTDDVYIDRFTLSRSVENTFVKSEIKTEIKFTGENHDYLFRKRLKGSEKETGQLTHECENQTWEKDVFISHNEGTFDLKRCVTTKKINFANPLDCLIGVNNINIFDYPAGVTQTVQGDLITDSYSFQKYIFLGEENYTLEKIISELGGIPDKTGNGLAIEYVYVTSIAEYDLIIDPQFTEKQYKGHNCAVYVRYVGASSVSQISSDWINISGTWYLNPSLFPVTLWGAPDASITTLENVDYINKSWEKGQIINYKDIPISNTVSLNAVLLGLFECTGLELVSNFFNINADGSNPENKYYDFATSYCHDIKIVQSFDIIRESSIEDSFGKSGLLTSKDILTDLTLFFNMMLVTDTTLNIARWEHVSYFQTKGYDVTSRTDIDISPFESDKEKIDSELFLMAMPTTDNFYKIKIKYSVPDLYKEENEKKYQVKKFLTDVFSTLNNKKFEGSEYEYLFYLLSTDGTSIIGLNNQFSMNNIFRNLHDLNRPYKTGQIGDTYTDFAGFSIGLETTIKFFSSVLTWDTLFPYMSIKTDIGTFKVETSEVNEKGLITLKCKT